MAATNIQSVLRQAHDGSADSGDAGEADVDSFTRVALASTSAPKTDSETRPPPDNNKFQPFSTIHSSASLLTHSANMNLQHHHYFHQPWDSAGTSSKSPSDCASLPVVVIARAECELAHPRPSRSSESRMLKVLVKGRGHAAAPAAEQSGEEEGSRSPRRRRQQRSRASKESTASFHTAQQSDHSDGG